MELKKLDIEPFFKKLDIEDKTLVDLYNSSTSELEQSKSYFENAINNFDANNYANFLVSKLYYEFAKEENQLYKYEIERRNIEI